MSPGARLNEVMPQWHFRKRPHRVRIDGPGEAVLRAVTEVTWSEVPLFSSLLRVSSFGRVRRDPARAVLDEFLSSGFTVLTRTDRELVLAAVSGGEPFPPEDAGGARVAWFRAYAEPASTKVAFDFRFVDGVLSTETRVLGADEAARNSFRRYWTLIRLPAGLVRREILNAVRRRVQP
ncbi:hypothetical protein GQF42_27840 [Streptomyces broussonetiae]|uniref:DUF2867 domain-containing protein n=2 Tax=Streptomyces broussonetiae TaxID=2686304 RepID=A0A6I6N552_9ACTN|nr:hypothetical protein [Streptomyces broussonetiae]QHA06584.1 hypothetical protein GQF42_27840 [Streptomyces broussonetiae]